MNALNALVKNTVSSLTGRTERPPVNRSPSPVWRAAEPILRLLSLMVIVIHIDARGRRSGPSRTAPGRGLVGRK